MYSVLRFSKTEESTGDILLLAEKVNAVIPEAVDRMDRVKDRFSITVAKADDWETHLSEIREEIGKLAPLLSEIDRNEFSLQLDVAIYSQEMANFYASFGIEPEFLSTLAGFGIELCFTVYKEG